MGSSFSPLTNRPYHISHRSLLLVVFMPKVDLSPHFFDPLDEDLFRLTCLHIFSILWMRISSLLSLSNKLHILSLVMIWKLVKKELPSILGSIKTITNLVLIFKFFNFFLSMCKDESNLRFIGCLIDLHVKLMPSL